MRISSRALFLTIFILFFVGVMAIGMTLLLKDKTTEAMQVFTGGGGIGVACTMFFFMFIDE